MTLSTATTRFLRHLEANGCSRHTVRSYRCDLAKLGRFVGERKPVRSITAHDLARFLTSDVATRTASNQPKGPGTMNRMRSVLRSFFRFLVETGAVTRNPAASLRANGYRKPVPQTLSDRDQRRLLKTLECSDDPLACRDLAIVELLLATGVRLSEAAALDVDDIDLRSGTMTIHVKSGGEQSRYLPRRLRRVLREYMRWRELDADALFVTRHGTRIGARHVHRRFRMWCERAGIDKPVSPHSLRHTLAVKFLDRTGNLRLVQQALGHRSITSTIRYTAVTNGALARALEAV